MITYILGYSYNSDTAFGAEFISTAAGGVLKICANFTGKHLCWSLQACNVTKNRLLHKCFPVKFEKC